MASYVNIRDMERLSRSMAAQRLDPAYIRHYLQETYQLDDKSIDTIFANLGIGKKKGVAAKELGAKQQPRRREFT